MLHSERKSPCELDVTCGGESRGALEVVRFPGIYGFGSGSVPNEGITLDHPDREYSTAHGGLISYSSLFSVISHQFIYDTLNSNWIYI